MASHVWQRMAIGIAAAASIATSVASPEWNVSAGAMLDAVVFDSQRTKASYTIHAEVSGPGPYKNLGGTLGAAVTAQQTGPYDSQTQLRLTLRSTTNPGVEIVEEVTLPNIEPKVAAELAAWTHCVTPPCAEDFELIVELVGTGAPPLDITGGVNVTASGDNNDLESTTQVTITASPLP